MTKTLAILAVTGCLFSVNAQNSETPGSQTFTGLLMDATCAPVTSTIGPSAPRAVEEGAGKEADRRSAALAGGPAQASATGTTGAASSTAAPSIRREGEARRDTDVAPDRNMRRETEAAVRGTPTAGPSWASATGTTGAAVGTAPPQTSQVRRADSRSRSDQAAETDTVAEKYAACRPKSGTTSFALHASGKLYVLDSASNEMVRKQMRNEAFSASMSNGRDGYRWMTVTVIGTPGDGNMLKVESVRK